MDRKLRPMFAVTVVTLSLGCAPSLESGEGDEGTPVAGRWYSVEQIQTGSRVFQDECAQCHGAQAQGITADWRERFDDGSFPPPPLNGSAHAWHHPLSVLLQVINQGGVPLGGQMPAFANRISDKEKLAAIAYFQSFWNDELYGNWEQMGGTE